MASTIDDLNKAVNGLNKWKHDFKAKLIEMLGAVKTNPSNYGNLSVAVMKMLDSDLTTVLQPLQNYIAEVSKTTTGTVPATASEINSLVKFADFLDEMGAHYLADNVTSVAFLLKAKKDSDEEVSMRPIGEGTLSTRHCPDHCGVPVARIGEGMYQCPLDGKVYNYEMGYTNFKGQRIPGGSIAEQTPSSSDCGGIPLRTYDGTQSVLNRIN